MDPGNMGPLGEWLPEAIWPKLKSLERIKRFSNIGDAMQSDSDDWQVREEQRYFLIAIAIAIAIASETSCYFTRPLKM